MEQYHWLQFEPKENAWPDWLWSRDVSAPLSQSEMMLLQGQEMDGDPDEVRIEGDEPDSIEVPTLLSKRILLADSSRDEHQCASKQGPET